MTFNVDVIIPTLNEQNGVGLVIKELPDQHIRNIYVVDNGSTDNTPEVAKNEGAIVLFENNKGYGYACLKGINHIKEKSDSLPDAILFIDGDHSDYPEQASELIEKLNKGYDMVIGSRNRGIMERGSMTPAQIFGNWLASRLIKLFYGVSYTDLGPFRIIRWDSLIKIDMQDKTYGWTVEMQLKAAKLKMKTCEIAVNYRNRIGTSKISGTIKGTVMAGYKIITTIFRYI